MTTIKNIFITLSFFIFCSVKAFASETMTGILQAYWQPDWTTNNVNNPELLLRLLKVDEKGNLKETVNINKTGLNERFIRAHFHATPNEFYKFHEGYVNQAGILKYDNFVKSGECGGNVANANYVDFTPLDVNVKVNSLIGQCDPHPYKLIYRLKDNIKSISLKESPNTSSKTIREFNSDYTITKIKTIDSKWFYVANYDEGQKDDIGENKGYIESDKLAPLN